MAEFRNLALGVVALLFFMVIAINVYANAALFGGYLNEPDFPGQDDIAQYLQTQNATTQLLINGTKSAAASPPTTDLSTGILSNAAIAGNTITLLFDSLKITLLFLDNAANSIAQFGVPIAIITIGKIFVALGFIITVLGAVFKWWI